LDWNEFKRKRRSFNWTLNEKTGKLQFRFIDKTTKETIEGNLSNFHKTIISHAKIPYDYDNFRRFNTRGLINCMETGISNFYFKECKAPMADGIARFYIKSRAGIQFTPKRKHDIFHTGSGLCNCGKIGSMKHILSCCPHRASLMTKRHNNVGRILAQAIEANNRNRLIKSNSGSYMHWNEELKLPDDVRNPRRFQSPFDQHRRRPDIWFYTRENIKD
jgi:hypothetical protein